MQYNQTSVGLTSNLLNIMRITLMAQIVKKTYAFQKNCTLLPNLMQLNVGPSNAWDSSDMAGANC